MQKKNIYQSNPLEEENGNQKVTKSNIDFDNVYNTTSATLTRGAFSKKELGELSVTLSTNKRNYIKSGVSMKLQYPSETTYFTSSETVPGSDSKIESGYSYDVLKYEDFKSNVSKLSHDNQQQKVTRSTSRKSYICFHVCFSLWFQSKCN
ncbi:unnamed protein product [Ambrosiozyma monospora]|uniref:Unnamed protein product n=1 Tax=Ambrosiozyma monospora TaxID=43982 RepID=A0ACB5UC27_AMBMO|nr:unnamed protein product [Ambrosiozyma monospora]